MNIFYIHPDAKICAQQHLSKHVNKMVIEYAQLMSTAHRVLDGEVYTELSKNGRRIKRWRLDDMREPALMKASHINHPSAIWCRDNNQNYQYLFTLWLHLLDEFKYRYGKEHACSRLIPLLMHNPKNINCGEFYPPNPAMPSELKIVSDDPKPGRKYDVLKSYRNYYNEAKRAFASWRGPVNSRPTPEWYKQ